MKRGLAILIILIIALLLGLRMGTPTNNDSEASSNVATESPASPAED
jgi:hypothetical protein